MRKPSILITGGLGFIFSHVTEYFVKRGYEVTVIDNCSVGSHPELVDGSFRFINANLAHPDAFEHIIEVAPDYIIHAAAITDVDFSIKNPRKTIENNVMSTLNVFKAAKQLPALKKILYVNTDEVYGECEYPKYEDDIMFPRNPYSASKAMCSYIRTSYDVTYGPLFNKTTEVRMCNIFGPRQDIRKINPLLIRALKDGTEVPLQEEGEGYREYFYVKNVAPTLELILESGNRVYNITNQEGMTVKDLIKTYERLAFGRIPTVPATRASHDRWYRMDNTRLKRLGWAPLYTFEQGLLDYLHYEQIKTV